MALVKKKFSEIDLSDPFFDSLKGDYIEFPVWFAKKSNSGDWAYVFYGDFGEIDGFLYLKEEVGAVDDVAPPLLPMRRLKLGTLKINPHGTRLGERFIKKVFDHAIDEGFGEIYVTVFEKHAALISLFLRYGFEVKASKASQNGVELVLVKEVFSDGKDVLERYPLVKTGGCSAYLLSLYPIWHTRLLPDSILRGEDESIVQDVSHTNSIHKVYLAAMRGMEVLVRGDVLLIYRTSDNGGPARFRSVVTSVCVVEDYRNINSFSTEAEFIKYCEPYSVFSLAELKNFWATKKYPHVLRFSYNFALKKRITRHQLLTEFGFSESAYPGFMKISTKQLMDIVAAGGVDEGLVVN